MMKMMTMNNEIKEILDKAKEISKYGTDGKQHTRFFNQFEAKSLLDYITNLEQVNKNQAKRNSRQRLANTKQQELILKLQKENERLMQDLQECMDERNSLQQENEYIKLSNPEMNIEHFRIINENKRKIDNLRKQNEELQEENERLKELIDADNESYDIQETIINRQKSELLEQQDYKSRCEKASNKIKKIRENAIKYGADHDAVICNDLLNILQNGSEKDG